MSRARFVPASVAVLCCLPGLLRAQFGISGGVAMPRGDFGQIARSGYELNALAAFPSSAPVTVRLEAGVNNMKYKLGSDASARVVSAIANAVMPLPGVKGPYAIAGFGVYRATAACSGCTTKSTKGGINAGAGYEFAMGAKQGFVEARLHHIGGPSDPTNAGIAGANTRYVPLLFGIVF